MPILFALIYGVSPIDLIPDILPLIGLVDDAILVPVLLLMGLAQLRKSRRATAQVPIIHPPVRGTRD
ncbi:MAG: YkvA family protein [Fimbriimonas sp.]